MYTSMLKRAKEKGVPRRWFCVFLHLVCSVCCEFPVQSVNMIGSNLLIFMENVVNLDGFFLNFVKYDIV